MLMKKLSMKPPLRGTAQPFMRLLMRPPMKLPMKSNVRPPMPSNARRSMDPTSPNAEASQGSSARMFPDKFPSRSQGRFPRRTVLMCPSKSLSRYHNVSFQIIQNSCILNLPY